MEKPKIAIILGKFDEESLSLVHATLDEPAMLELCTPLVFEEEKADAAWHTLSEGRADALVLATAASAPQVQGAVEIIATGQAQVLPLQAEPTEEDVASFRNILERDFDLLSPRIAIVQETAMANPDLAAQVTAELGINTYGPYTTEQILADERCSHFDGIIAVGDGKEALRIADTIAREAPARFFAGRDDVVAAVCLPPHKSRIDDACLLTQPVFTAIDVLRNRANYDEALQNPLPKLFRDKRDDRRREAQAQANTNNENTEKPS